MCPACEYVAWDNPKPAVGVVIEKGGKVLFVRRERAPYKAYWDLPGGFAEAGEEPAKGAMREAREETGLRVKVDRLIGAYADVYREATNSGHTFNDDRNLAGSESMFFPRIGDYAVVHVNPAAMAGLTPVGEVKTSGFFDESWKLK